jgi:peptidoglycan/xylan/chitin deacetylase (PgdA/CDA1 family)
MPQQSVVFLMYHELEMPGRPLLHSHPGYVRYVLRTADFERQMEFLRNEGWSGLSVGQAIRFSHEKAVAITFDDGSETDLLCAAPVLRELGFGATFYVTSSWVGQPGYINHSQLRELSALGFEIGCHSMSHVYLTDVDEHGLRREMVQSKSELEQFIGKPVEHFSCPGGRYDQRAARMAEEAGYRTITTSTFQANSSATDRFALGRAAVLRSCSLSEFRQICLGRRRWRSRVGLQLRRASRRLLGNSVYDRLRDAVLSARPDQVE